MPSEKLVWSRYTELGSQKRAKRKDFKQAMIDSGFSKCVKWEIVFVPTDIRVGVFVDQIGGLDINLPMINIIRDVWWSGRRETKS